MRVWILRLDLLEISESFGAKSSLEESMDFLDLVLAYSALSWVLLGSCQTLARRWACIEFLL